MEAGSGLERELDPEGRAVAGPAAHRDAAVVVLHDHRADRKAQPEPLADRLRREERLEQFPPDVLGHAAAGVDHLDDDLDLLELLKDALHEEYDVDVASTALDAATRLAAFQPDVILLDIRLPDLSGLQVCRHFQSYKKARNVPILTMSAYGGEIDPHEVRLSGADDFLPKPLRLAELKQRIHAMVG